MTELVSIAVLSMKASHVADDEGQRSFYFIYLFIYLTLMEKPG
jgi:hypothetical protein